MTRWSFVLQLSLALLLCTTAYANSPDFVETLPGLKSPPAFKNYAGYSTVDAAHGRALFWFFSEASDVDPATAPVVLWLTGGPGCSSLSAWLTENGPWRPKADGSLEPFEYAWNRVANVVWLESPAGVGFSYSNTTSDYNTDDEQTANDTFNALQDILGNRLPQFAKNDFWITGESYGGHYVPEAAARILKGGGAIDIQLKGFMVGNAWTVPPVDNFGAVSTWWQRALIPKRWADDVVNNCNLSDYGPLTTQQSVEALSSAACDEATARAMGTFGNAGVDIYDIYIDACGTSTTHGYVEALAQAGSPVHRILKHIRNKRVAERRNLGDRLVDPCLGNYVGPYMNNVDVQRAIHVRNPGSKRWNECGGVNYSYKSVMSSVLPIYADLMNNTNLHLLVYSGDVDAIVPYDGSRLWINSLGRKVVNPWRAWINHDAYGPQAGGFVEEFDRLTFATVREAGHQVPEYRPSRAFTMFSWFLANQTLPSQ